MFNLKESFYFDKLSDDNFQVRMLKIEKLIIKEYLYDIVCEHKKENYDNQEKKVKNARVFFLNDSDSQIVHIRHTTNTNETYNQLQSVHKMVNFTNKFYLFRKLSN